MANSPGVTSLYGSSLESARWRARGVGRAQPSRLLIAAFAGFVGSLPFETALLLGSEGSFAVSRFLGYLMFGLALLQPGVCFRKPPRALWWFAIYVGLFALSGFLRVLSDWPDTFANVFRLTQLLLVLCVGYKLFQYERVVRWALWGFGLASVGVAGLLASGIGATQFGRAVGRETVFGAGPNVLAATVALGALMLIGMAYGRVTTGGMTKLAVWVGFLVVAMAVARTGSRGALVAMGAGLMTLLASRGSARDRIRNAVMVLLALVLCYVATISYAPAATRWRESLEKGSLAGREFIYPAAWKMFKEKPILGWGVMNQYELGNRLNLPRRDTHNLLLWLLTELGLVGTIPFCIGLALCARAAWRGRRGTQGLLPLALLVASLSVNLSVTADELKWFWLILAYSLASETYLRVPRARRTELSATRPRSDGFARSGTATGRLRQRPASVSLRTRTPSEIGHD